MDITLTDTTVIHVRYDMRTGETVELRSSNSSESTPVAIRFPNYMHSIGMAGLDEIEKLTKKMASQALDRDETMRIVQVSTNALRLASYIGTSRREEIVGPIRGYHEWPSNVNDIQDIQW